MNRAKFVLTEFRVFDRKQKKKIETRRKQRSGEYARHCEPTN